MLRLGRGNGCKALPIVTTSGGVAEDVAEVINERVRCFSQVARGRGCLKSHMSPEGAAHEGDRIREGRGLFVVPGSPFDEGCALGPVGVGDKGDEGEQAEQHWGGAANGFLGPPASGLDAKMITDLMERGFHLPAEHEPGDDLDRGGRTVGTQESLGGEGVVGITDEDPAERHGGQAGAVPQSRLRDNLDRPVPLAVSERDRDRSPRRCRISEAGGEGGQTLSDDTGPSLLARNPGGWGRKEASIKAQTGHDRRDVAARKSRAA